MSYYKCHRCDYISKQKIDMKRHLDKKIKCIIKNDNNLNETDIISKFKNKSKITIGRNSDNDVWLDNSVVSKIHATIESKGGNSYVLTDLGSLNGTFLNGKRISGSEKVVESDDFLVCACKILTIKRGSTKLKYFMAAIFILF